MLQVKKVLKVGNSLGATFPKSFVDKHDIKKGDRIVITHSNGCVTYSVNVPVETEYEDVSDEEFFKVVKRVDSKYKKALDELAVFP